VGGVDDCLDAMRTVNVLQTHVAACFQQASDSGFQPQFRI